MRFRSSLWLRGIAAVAALALASVELGCASTSPKAAFDDVASRVEQQSGHRLRVAPGETADASDSEERAREQVQRIVSERPLSADAAVEVTLLVNPALRASLEELALAQANLVQAGLLKNPIVAAGITAWEAEHLSPNVFASVEYAFIDALTLPLRKRVAAREAETIKFNVAARVLEFTARTREAFYRAQAAVQLTALRRLVESAAQASAEVARRQHDAGNLSALALQSELALAIQARVDLRQTEGEAARAREELNKAMGVWGRQTSWTLGSLLPELPADEAPLADLEERAVAQRMDLQAAACNVQALEAALTAAKTTRWTGTVDVAVDVGRLRPTHHVSFGPRIALEIPIFDQRQAQIAKLEAAIRQAQSQKQALAIDVRADVRASHARVMAARDVARAYAAEVVPVREQTVRFAQQHYDAMLLGVYQLLAAKQSEYDAYRGSVEALRDYWIARSELEFAVGGRVGAPPKTDEPKASASGVSPSTTQEPALTSPNQDPHQHHHQHDHGEKK